MTVRLALVSIMASARYGAGTVCPASRKSASTPLLTAIWTSTTGPAACRLVPAMVKEGTSDVQVAGDEVLRCLYLDDPLHQKGYVSELFVALVDRIPFRLVGADDLIAMDQDVFSL